MPTAKADAGAEVAADPIAIPGALAAVPEPTTDAGLNGDKRALGDRVVEAPGADGNFAPDAYTGPMIEVFRVLIRRDETSTIPVDVPEYEIPILELAHGPQNIVVSEEPVNELQLITDNADDEYQRLFAKYDRKNAPNPVVGVYGSTPRELAAEMGLEFGRNRSRRVPQAKASEQVDHKPFVPRGQ